jgi:hypothetical protein
MVGEVFQLVSDGTSLKTFSQIWAKGQEERLLIVSTTMGIMNRLIADGRHILSKIVIGEGMPEKDRISYGFSMKVNMGNYQSADFHVSLSSDVAEGETPSAAFARIVKFVEKESEKKLNELGKTAIREAE